MISGQACRFWDLMRAGPKQIAMPIAERRAAGEHAEDATAEPAGVAFAPAARGGGIWAQPAEARPGAAMLYLFGGGYMPGSPASRRKTAGHLAAAAGARVLVPNYRLAPEHPFPAAVDDAVQAYRWLLAQGAEPTRTVIAGDSAGGGLAVATAIAARDRGLPLPAGIVTLSAWADLTCSGDSMTSRAATDIECTREGLLEMAGWCTNGADPRQPLASPVFADFAGLPPLLALVGGDETLLDDSIRLARGAGMAGGDATLFIGAGMQHVFPIWAGAFPEADAAIATIGAWVRARTGSGLTRPGPASRHGGRPCPRSRSRAARASRCAPPRPARRRESRRRAGTGRDSSRCRPGPGRRRC
jgi:monoterpene epsilon-lactone hydrolase